MLGRKAILHSSAAGKKRKWQLQQERDDQESSDDDGVKPQKRPGRAVEESRDATAREAAPQEREGDEERASSPLLDVPNLDIASGKKSVGEEAKEAKAAKEEEDSSDSDGDKKGKAFAWMDSDDEVSEEGDGEEDVKSGSGLRTTGSADPRRVPSAAAPLARLPGLPGPPGPSNKLGPAAAALLAQAGAKPQLGGRLLPLVRTPAELLPGTQLPLLTENHLALMAKIAALRTLGDLWALVDDQAETFAAAHAATSLFKLSALGSASMPGGTTVQQLDPKSLERNSSFARLRDRVDELLSTDKGRASFMTADLAMVASSLAKVVQAPATEGALGRIFEDVADEAEARLASEPLAFTPPMLADLAWGLAKSSEDPSSPGMGRANFSASFRRFFGAAIEATVLRLEEMTCQDLANLAAAYGDALREDADVLLKGVFHQAQSRLKQQPQPTNALFGASAATPGATNPPQPPAAQSQLKAPAMDEGLPLWQRLGHWRFTGAQIVDISVAMSKHTNLYEAALFDQVASQFHARLQELSLPQLQKLRDAFDTVRYDRDLEFLMALRGAVKQREFLTRRR